MRKRVAKKILQRYVDRDGFGIRTTGQISKALTKRELVEQLFPSRLIPHGWELRHIFPRRPTPHVKAKLMAFRDFKHSHFCPLDGANANPA